MKIMLKTVPVLMSMAVTLLTGISLTHAATQHIVIDSGDNALSREEARERQQQWNDTQSLRHKINQRAGKEFDKTDRAFDARDKCQQSENLNAYWEPNTRRCLDRQTGRPITP